MKLVLMLLMAWLIDSLLLWWWGRVFLPEVGLTAPDLFVWIASLLPLMIAAAFVGVIRSVVSDT